MGLKTKWTVEGRKRDETNTEERIRRKIEKQVCEERNNVKLHKNRKRNKWNKRGQVE